MNKRKTNALREKDRKTLRYNTLEELHDYRVDLDNFSIYIGSDPNSKVHDNNDESGVTCHMADRFEISLDQLKSRDQNHPILVKIASCGGDWEIGMQIFGAILTSLNPITVIAVRDARSMTSIIPLAADKFLIRPPAKYMYHEGSYECSGPNRQAATNDKQRRIDTELMIQIYAARLKEQGKYCKEPAKNIRDMLVEEMSTHMDVWHHAVDAVEWGFADGVFVGDYKNLRAKKRNLKRRETMMNVLLTQIDMEEIKFKSTEPK